MGVAFLLRGVVRGVCLFSGAVLRGRLPDIKMAAGRSECRQAWQEDQSYHGCGGGLCENRCVVINSCAVFRCVVINNYVGISWGDY